MSRGYVRRSLTVRPEAAKASESAPMGSAEPAYLGREDDPESILGFEKKYRTDKLETAGAFDKNGKKLFDATNNASDFVKFGRMQSAAVLQNEGAIMTHNHPTSRSFSPADFHLMFNFALSEIRAVGEKYTYILKDPNGVLKNYVDMKYDPDRQGYKVAPLGGTEMRVGRWGTGVFATPEATEELWHMVVSKDERAKIAEKFMPADGSLASLSGPSSEQMLDFERELTHLRAQRLAANIGLVYERIPTKKTV